MHALIQRLDHVTDYWQVKGINTFTGIYYKTFLPLLTEKIETDKLPKVKLPTLPQPPFEDDHEDVKITHTWIWHELAKFFKPHDIVFGETGTTIFGMADISFPSDVTYVKPCLYPQTSPG